MLMRDLQVAHLLLEHIDLGDRVRGVFATPEEATAAIHELRRLDTERFGAVGIELPHDYLARFHVATFVVGALDYP